MPLEQVPEGYRALQAADLPEYVLSVPAAFAFLGAKEGDHAQIESVEVGDGNLNLVFFVTHRGTGKRLVVKQALPYVRCIGDSWPLTLARAHYENAALVEEERAAPELVPHVFHYDPTMATIIMEMLTPHIILRKGLIARTEYPRVAEDIGRFLAQTLFRTSDLGLPSSDKKKLVAKFATNIEMCDLTHGVIFTDPYAGSPHNKHTSPQLDALAEQFLHDTEAKIAIANLKFKFMNDSQALIHADLHTGSVMVTPDSTKVIDPEFAFYGPMGFDIGAFLANLLLSYFSHSHDTAAHAYSEWLLAQVEKTWSTFETQFVHLWNTEHRGDVFSPKFLGAATDGLHTAQRRFLAAVFQDSIGFCAAKMIRRIVGVAHVEDLESIADKDIRARCETHALHLARDLLVHPGNVKTIADLTARARAELKK